MTSRTESQSRLNRLLQKMDPEALAKHVRTSPLADEMNLPDADQVKQLLATPPGELEAATGVPPMKLEAIVRAVGRPPLAVKDGTVVGKSNLFRGDGGFPADIDIQIHQVEPMLASVGRIEFFDHHMTWGGTGWVIAKEDDDSYLIVTNRHVAQLVARRTWRGGAVFLMNAQNIRYGAAVDFLKEDGRMEDRSRQVRIDKFTYIADDLAADIALARITGAAGLNLTPLPLVDETAPPEDGELIAICGYPARDSRNDALEMERYFQGLYDVKRFAPGYIIAPPGSQILSHDATSLGGNSGSPVIRLSDQKVVGLHFAGSYGVGNSAVRDTTLRRLLDKGATGAVMLGDMPTLTTEGSSKPDSFAGRTGYDPTFLGVVPIPMPKVAEQDDLSTPSDASADRPHELRYQHFSVLFSKSRKAARLTALNIDGSLTKAVKDYGYWRKDLRIPAEEQLGDEEYRGTPFDRGHLVRRAATNWGADVGEANRANKDTFHFTVAAPQHHKLNRDVQTWRGLEDYILYSARTHGFRATVFTGPIYRDDDPQFEEFGVPMPREFFKVVVMLATQVDEPNVLRPHATAYVVSQGHILQEILSEIGSTEGAEGFEYGAYRTFQVRISDLESAAGIDFGLLRHADPLARVETIATGHAQAVEIQSYADLRL